jgi:HD-like signal output (HDOD) protein
VDFGSLSIKLARSENLPVLPQVVSSVLKLADDPEASPKEMERLIESDPAITGKILRVANSAYYGLHEVPSIGRAVTALGMNTIRSLVIGVAYQQLIAGREQAALFSKLEFWRHSLAVAVGCRIIAKIKCPMKSEELYGVGMMHDVGKLVMDRFCPNDFDLAIQTAQNEQCPLNEAEVRLYEFDHTDVGGLLADKWGLTKVMRAGIKHHHSVIEDQNFHETTCIVAIANGLAHQCGFNNNIALPDYEIDAFALSTIELPEEQLEIIRNVVVHEVVKAQEAFHIS